MNAQLYVQRKERNLKQSDIAKILSIRTETYCKKETGDRDFTETEMRWLAKYYGCTLDELFDNKNYNNNTQINDEEKILNDITDHLEQIVILLRSRRWFYIFFNWSSVGHQS